MVSSLGLSESKLLMRSAHSRPHQPPRFAWGQGCFPQDLTFCGVGSNCAIARRGCGRGRELPVISLKCHGKQSRALQSKAADEVSLQPTSLTILLCVAKLLYRKTSAAAFSSASSSARANASSSAAAVCPASLVPMLNNRGGLRTILQTFFFQIRKIKQKASNFTYLFLLFPYCLELC